MKSSQINLEKIAKIQHGKSITKKNYIDNGFPAFSAKGNDGFLDHAEFEEDGIVLSAIGARCGKCFKALGKWTAINNTITIIPDKTKVDIDYLYAQLNDEKSWKKSGAAQPFISLSAVRDRLIILPPLKEQQRIKETLNTVNNIINKREHAITKLDKLEQSLFIDMFGNNNKSLKLKEVCTFINGGTPSKKKIEFWNGHIPWISSADIEKDNIKTIRHFLTDLALINSSTNLVPANSVLVVTRTGLGKVVVVDQDICFSQDITGLKLKPEYEPDFVASAIRIKKNEIKKEARGATIKGVTRKVIENLDVPFVSLKQQKIFVEKLQSINKLKKLFNQKAEAVNKMYFSLKHQLFAMN